LQLVLKKVFRKRKKLRGVGMTKKHSHSLLISWGLKIRNVECRIEALHISLVSRVLELVID
jgi:hypothetical protein